MIPGWAGGGHRILPGTPVWDLGVSEPCWGTSQSEGGDRSEAAASPTPLLRSCSGVSPVADPKGPGPLLRNGITLGNPPSLTPPPAISNSVPQVGRGVGLPSECPGALQLGPSPVCPFPPEPCHPPVKLQPGILALLCPKLSAAPRQSPHNGFLGPSAQDPDFSHPIPGCLAGILVAVPRTHLIP